MAPTLRIQLLGEFRLFLDDQPVDTLNQPRQQALLAYLLLQRHAPHHRQQIASSFWPDSTEKQAHTNLRKLIHYLRQVLPAIDTFLFIDHYQIGWHKNVPITLDVAELEECLDRLEQACAAGQALISPIVDQVIALYQGELLPTCYEDWLLSLRRALHERVVNGLTEVLVRLEVQHEYKLGIRCAEYLLRLDPLHEMPYRHLMHFRALTGDRAGALQVYHECARILEQELGVPPAAETQVFYQHLLKTESQPAVVQIPHAIQIPLVGRQAEWQRLQQAWRDVTRQGTHFVVIWGEAGVGKTRLVEELLHWAQLRPGSVAYARAYATESAMAYAPVTTWLRSESLRQALPQLEQVWLTELVRLLPELLTENPELPPPTPLSESWQRQRFHEALARAALAAPQPLLLVLDDLQWCDTETLAWLHLLLRMDPRVPLLGVGTVRSEAVDATHPLHEFLRQLHRASQCTELELAPLSAAETMTLAEHLIGIAVAPWAMELYRETEGNPLFVVETVRAGLLEKRQDDNDGRLRMLPSTVKAVIATRMAQLSTATRQLAQLAATIGRLFTVEVLAEASGIGEEALFRGLDELWQRRIVREQGEAYDFSHDKIREVAYSQISPMRRRLLHSRVAQALEHLHANRLPEVAGGIAAHYEQAGNGQKAVDYFIAAGRHAADQFAHGEAVAHYTRALNWLPENEIETRFGILLLRESVYYTTGQLERHQQDLRALVQLASALVSTEGSSWQQAEVAVRYAQYFDRVGKFAESADAAQQAVKAAQLSKADEIEARGYFHWGMALWSQGRMREAHAQLEQATTRALSAGDAITEAKALEYLSATGWFTGAAENHILDNLARCMTIYQRTNNLVGQASTHNRVGYVIVAQGNGNLEQAHSHYEQSRQIARQIGLRSLEGVILSNVGVLNVLKGNYAEARGNLDLSLKIAQEIGNYLRQAVTLNYLGYESHNRGDYGAAQTYQEASLQITQQIGNRQWRTKAHNELGLTLLELGKFGLASEQAHQALQVARELADPRQEAAAWTTLGHIYTACRQWQHAAHAYQQAFDQHQAMEQLSRTLVPLAGLAEVALHNSDLGQAKATVEQILHHLQNRQLDYTDESLRVYLKCHTVLQANQDPRAPELLRTASAQLQARAATLETEEMRQLFWSAPLHQAVMLNRETRY